MTTARELLQRWLSERPLCIHADETRAFLAQPEEGVMVPREPSELQQAMIRTAICEFLRDLTGFNPPVEREVLPPYVFVAMDNLITKWWEAVLQK